jgi:hypothetical protein
VVTTILSMRILLFAKPHPKIFPHYSWSPARRPPVLKEEGAPLLPVHTLSLADHSLVVKKILLMMIRFFVKPRLKIFSHYSWTPARRQLSSWAWVGKTMRLC